MSIFVFKIWETRPPAAAVDILCCSYFSYLFKWNSPLCHSGATSCSGSAQYPNRLEREAMILSSFAGIIMVSYTWMQLLRNPHVPVRSDTFTLEKPKEGIWVLLGYPITPPWVDVNFHVCICYMTVHLWYYGTGYDQHENNFLGMWPKVIKKRVLILISEFWENGRIYEKKIKSDFLIFFSDFWL